jgi:hypothetical protein
MKNPTVQGVFDEGEYRAAEAESQQVCCPI